MSHLPVTAGIDQAMLSDEQKAAERQLNEQKPQEQPQAAAQQSAQHAGQEEAATQTAEEQLQAQADATPEQLQQSAQTAGQEEAAELRAEEQLDAQSDLTSEQAASPQAASASDQGPRPQSDDEAEMAETALSQPSQLAQEHAAEPQEPQLAPTTLTTAADENIPAHAESQLSDLPAAKRLQILLEAIRNRTWEQTEEEKASAAKLQDDSLTLPASGYSEIGAISQGRFQGQMLNPERTFYPGQSYHPEVSSAHTGTVHRQSTLLFTHKLCSIVATCAVNTPKRSKLYHKHNWKTGKWVWQSWIHR